jgi:hypothetical protein
LEEELEESKGSNQNPYVEGQITHQKKKDKRTDHNLQNTTRKTKDHATRNPQKIGGDIRWSKRVYIHSIQNYLLGLIEFLF